MTARRLRVRWRVTAAVESLDRLLAELRGGAADELRASLRDGRLVVEAALARVEEHRARLLPRAGVEAALLERLELEALRGAPCGDLTFDLPALVRADVAGGPAEVSSFLDLLGSVAWAVDAELRLGSTRADRHAVRLALEAWIQATCARTRSGADQDADVTPTSVVEVLVGLPREEVLHVARRLGVSTAGSREAIAQRVAEALAATGHDRTQAVELVLGVLRKSGLIALLAGSAWDDGDGVFLVRGRGFLARQARATLEDLARLLTRGQVRAASLRPDLEGLLEEDEGEDFEDEEEEEEEEGDDAAGSGFGGLGDDEPPPSPPPSGGYDGGAVGSCDVEWFLQLAGLVAVRSLRDLTVAWRTVAKLTHPDSQGPDASHDAFCRAGAVYAHLKVRVAA